MNWLIRLQIVLLLLTGYASAESFVLVEDGKARCGIVLSDSPSEDEKLAARELSHHVELMSGVRLEQSEGSGRSIQIVVDETLDDIFKLDVDAKSLRIIGRNGEGCLFGAYEVLEQLGVRWFFPGEAGRVYPRRQTLEIPLQVVSQSPSFTGRHLQGGLSMDKKSWATWLRRIRCGGPHVPKSHGLRVPKQELERDPEMRALIGGKRIGKQICLTHPRALQLVTEHALKFFRENPDREWLGMGPKDGRGFCRCEACLALDAGEYDRHSRRRPLTDRYIWFLNQVAESVAEEFPDKKIAFYAYAAIATPPLKVKPHPNLVPAIAPINYCRIHGVDHPLCEESREVLELWRGWKALSPEVYHRGYWFNLADPGLTFPLVHRIRREIPLAKEVGLEGFRVECTHPWANQLPSLWIASKLMWDHEADVDALLDEFFLLYYGEQAAPHMKAAFKLFEEALSQTTYHTGSSWDFPLIYPASIFEVAEVHYGKAWNLAGAEERERIEWTRQATQMTRDFNRMLEARNRHDWVEAKNHLDSVNAVIEELTALEPPMLSRRYAARFMERFFAPATEQGFAISRDHKTLHQFPHTWRFQLDPKNVGRDEKWYARTHPDWTELSSALSWSTQGLRYYNGAAWYESSFEADFQGGARLWFAGVDERADIWLNGELVAEGVGKAFQPFEVEIKQWLRGSNQLTVRVVNYSLNELGTGGILGPVVLYARK